MIAGITGATGFLGPYILKELCNEYDKVIVLARNPEKVKTEIDPEKIQIVQGDITRIEDIRQAFDGIDHLFHLAAKVSSFPKDPNKGYIQTNLEGTENILKVADEFKIKRLIYTSSFFALGPTGEIIADESHDVRLPMKHPYADTKYDAGKLVDAYQPKHFDKISILITTAMGIGLGDQLTQVIIDFCNGKLPGLPNGGANYLNYVLARSVAHGHILAAKNGKNGEKYIIGGENLTFIDFLMLFGNPIGRKPPRSLPIKFVKVYVWLMEKFSRNPQLSVADFEISNLNWRYTSKKAINELSYSVIPINEETVVKPLFQDFISKGLLKKKIKEKVLKYLNNK